MRSKFSVLSIIALFLLVGFALGVSQPAFAGTQVALARKTSTPTRTSTKLPTLTATLTPTVIPGTPTWTGTPSLSDFYGSPLSGAAPLAVQFTARYGPVYNCTWTFGDGTSQTFGPIGANGYAVCPAVTHTYSAVGSYTVSLRVSPLSGSANFTTTKTNYIQVTASGTPTPTTTKTPTKLPTVSGT